MTDREGRPVILVKLGGSLVTRKGRDASPRPDVITRLARELAEGLETLREGLVLGHGSGSFGHPPAARHGLREGLRGRDALEGLSLTQERAARLHRIVVERLREAGLPAFSVAPSSAAVAREGAVRSFALEPMVLALERGMLPVTYGDVLMDRSRGATVVSTESVFRHLAGQLPRRGWTVRRVLWLGDTEGVYDGEGQVIPEIRRDGADPGLVAAAGAGTTDVTGGMAHRVETALALADRGILSWIGRGSRGRLRSALAGQPVEGTRVLPPG